MAIGTAGPAAAATATPIQHLVVIFQENVSFDHYFGTYPKAANTDGQTFNAKADTPKVNGLTQDLLTHNPNSVQPQRLGPDKAFTCDQDHEYGDEQKAFNGGKMDQFVEHTDVPTCTGGLYGRNGLVMDYYDGNTTTGMWNYAQRFAMSDNSFGTTFGPSTPGAINLISGQTHGAVAQDKTGKPSDPAGVVVSPDAKGVGTVIDDPDPAFDDCSNPTKAGSLLAMQGKNIGDLLSEKKVSWGFFQGGFKPTSTKADGTAVCGSAHKNLLGANVSDYSPHHQPFEYYKSTSNQHHVAPSSASAIGHDDQANHQYDISDFDTALQNDNLPAVSYLKAAKYQDGHAGYSDPLDEQQFVVDTINKLQKSKDWASTAVVIEYDDSDGWYDHVPGPIKNSSHDKNEDALTAPGVCGDGKEAGGYLDRCGYGPRLPLLVISPYAKSNFVDHTVTDQTSTLRFIEDNWKTGDIGDHSFDELAGKLDNMFDFEHPNNATLILDKVTGQPTPTTPSSSATPSSGATPSTTGTATASGNGDQLANTGANVQVVALVAGALVVLGGGAVFVARRRAASRG
ncbi:alkaline phosphatase family protein [Solihabitans fulvus]|nr:alkaline phosphatase family protein [Solihabitans fulvus]